MVQPFPEVCEVWALALVCAAGVLLADVFAFEFELPQPVAASGTSATVKMRARCRTARKASDAP